jgi:hypothetical protein
MTTAAPKNRLKKIMTGKVAEMTGWVTQMEWRTAR